MYEETYYKLKNEDETSGLWRWRYAYTTQEECIGIGFTSFGYELTTKIPMFAFDQYNYFIKKHWEREPFKL